MGYASKIATCCYCGARAALVLGAGRHELTCASCGAPLHDLKRLPSEAVEKHRDNPRLPPRAATPEPVREGRKARKGRKGRKGKPPKSEPSRPRKQKKRKKRKSLGRWLVSEAFDVIEDILD